MNRPTTASAPNGTTLPNDQAASSSGPIGPFWVGDIPAAPARIAVARNGSPADLTGRTVAASLVRPSGYADPLPATVSGSEVLVTFPADRSLFAARGLYRIALTFTVTATGAREQGSAVRFPVEAEDGWHTLATARDEWGQAAPRDDVTLFKLLTIARDQIIDLADRDISTVPLGCQEAQWLHARNIYNATSTAVRADGGVSGNAPTFRPHPIDWHIAQLVNPRRGGIGGAA